jgi:Domain of unknown function (DUF4280)
MPQLVVTGAMLACTFGAAPGPFTASLNPTITTGGSPTGCIMDMVPMSNIAGFTMCMSPSNPQVAAATAAAMGVLTPQPCIPMTAAPWTPGSTSVTLNGQPALDSTCTCMCTWGGMISVTSPGQMVATDG